VESSKHFFQIANQIFDVSRKLSKDAPPESIRRNIDKIENLIEMIGFEVEDPMGQYFDETRNDLDASISGSVTENLKVIEVIKPIIRQRFQSGLLSASSIVVQKGVVVVAGSSDIE
jgi:hypothetical protein